MALFRGIVAAVATIVLLQTGALAQSGKVYRVGLVGVGAPDTGILGTGMVRNFTRRGYVVDGNIVFERRAAQGQPDRLPGLIDELVAKHVDVIITQSYPAALAAKERAGKTPIVVTNSGDPVATGLAASLAHPGGNVTGVSDVAGELSAKRLALLKEAVPSVRKVAVLWNADDLGMTLRYRAAEVEAPAPGHARSCRSACTRRTISMPPFPTMTNTPPDAILMVTDILTVLNRKRVIEYAAGAPPAGHLRICLARP